MQRQERVGAQWQPRCAFPAAGQRVGQVARVRERRPDELAQLLRQLLARRIDGREVRGGGAAVQVVGADCEPVAVRRPRSRTCVPGASFSCEPRLVEPGRGDPPLPSLTCAVRICSRPRPRRDDALAPRPRSPPRRRPKLGDPPHGHGLLVAPRAVAEQVADALEPELRQPPLERRPDARERVERRLELLGPEAAARRRPASGGSTAGETRAVLAAGQRVEYRQPDGRLASRRRCESSWNQKKPTVPGPACVPTTAPSVRHELDLRRGPARLHERPQLLDRSGASACAIPTRSPGPSVVAAVKRFANSGERLPRAAHARQRHAPRRPRWSGSA